MISVADLRVALKDPPASENAYVKQLEAAAVALIERETGKYYGPVRTRTEIAIGTGFGTLQLVGPVALDVYGVAQIASVNESQYAGGTASEIVADGSGGFIVRESVLYRRSGGFWRSGYEYVVVYEQGYAEGEEPADIRQAVMQLVALWYEARLPVVEAGTLADVPFSLAQIIADNRLVRA